jgi:hypothetical protein
LLGEQREALTGIPDGSADPTTTRYAGGPPPRDKLGEEFYCFCARYLSNHAMIAEVFAADCDGRPASQWCEASGTLTRAVGTPRNWSAA